MTDWNCKGCEFHGDCATAVLTALGSPDVWGCVNGTEKKPECRTWQRRTECPALKSLGPLLESGGSGRVSGPESPGK